MIDGVDGSFGRGVIFKDFFFFFFFFLLLFDCVVAIDDPSSVFSVSTDGCCLPDSMNASNDCLMASASSPPVVLLFVLFILLFATAGLFSTSLSSLLSLHTLASTPLYFFESIYPFLNSRSLSTIACGFS